MGDNYLLLFSSCCKWNFIYWIQCLL